MSHWEYNFLKEATFCFSEVWYLIHVEFFIHKRNIAFDLSPYVTKLKVNTSLEEFAIKCRNCPQKLPLDGWHPPKLICLYHLHLSAKIIFLNLKSQYIIPPHKNLSLALRGISDVAYKVLMNWSCFLPSLISHRPSPWVHFLLSSSLSLKALVHFCFLCLGTFAIFTQCSLTYMCYF